MQQLLIFLAMGVMVTLLIQIETDLISWIFFTLNMVQLGFLIRGKSDSASVSACLWIANIIKLYALTVLITQVGFVSFIGATASTEPNSVD